MDEDKMSKIDNYGLSVFDWGTLGEQEPEAFLAVDPFLAEAIVGTKAGGVGVEGVRAIFEGDVESVDTLAVIVQVVSQIHLYGLYYC